MIVLVFLSLVALAVEVAFSAAPPKIQPVKPKMYILCNFVLPGETCVDLSE